MARKRTCQPCSGCGIAWYCSKKCKDDDYKAGHKRLCGTVLTQHATNEEGELYHEVFGNDLPGDALLIGSPCSTKKVTCATLDCHEEHVVVLGEDDDDDDGSWESMDSDVEDEGEEEGSASSRTKAICRFFKSKAKAFSAL